MPDDPAFVWESHQRSSPPASGERGERPRRIEAPRAEAPAPTSEDTGSDGILVPLDEWARILRQLGNLHEAGRDLAEARERAAKAETEAGFLRERVRELRSRLEETEARQAEADRPRPVPSFGEWVARRWLHRREAEARSGQSGPPAST